MLTEQMIEAIIKAFYKRADMEELKDRIRTYITYFNSAIAMREDKGPGLSRTKLERLYFMGKRDALISLLNELECIK